MTLHRFAQLVAVATFALLIAGALVTSTGSGLSVPDWPLSYGTLFPKMVGGIRFEHTHRMMAGFVGLLTLVLALWLWRRDPATCRADLRSAIYDGTGRQRRPADRWWGEPRRGVRWLGVAAFGTVIAQALLGGLTVLLQLPLPISVAHACLAQTFFCLAIALAVVTSRDWLTEHAPALPDARMLWLSAATTGMILLQLALGAALRHSGYSLRLHLAGALAVAAMILRLAVMMRRSRAAAPQLARPAALLTHALLLQLALGALSAWVHPTVLIRTAHVVTGALLLAASLTLTLWAYRLSPRQPPHARNVPAYLALTKPRLTLLAVITTAVGFLLGAQGRIDARQLGYALLGAALVGGGAAALNQYLERGPDAKMRRTQRRPLPAGQLQPAQALRFGVALSVAGLLLLAWRVNLLTGSLGALTLITYLFLYTPLKPRSPLCTLVGAVPGALPPLMGWAAARNTLTLEAWALFAILFLWQLPHFLALAWLYREDYAAAGFRMLTLHDPDGQATARQMVLYSTALLPATLLPTLLGVTGAWYFFGALVLSAAFCACGVAAAIGRSQAGARRLFLASIAYLPLLLLLMTVDHLCLWRSV